jgi:hypothetical protein
LTAEQFEIKSSVLEYKNVYNGNYNLNEFGLISEMEIVDYITQMKNSNSCGFDGVSANMVKNALSKPLCKQLMCLLKAIIEHIPPNFNTTIIGPLIKNKSIKKFLVSNFPPPLI